MKARRLRIRTMNWCNLVSIVNSAFLLTLQGEDDTAGTAILYKSARLGAPVNPLGGPTDIPEEQN